MNLTVLRKDFLAGVVVFLVALPLSLGIAQACDLPAFAGLLSGVIGGVVVTLFSPSRFAVSGPAAGLVTIVTGAVATLGSYSLILLAIAIAGLLQAAFGLLRAGRWIGLIPDSVIQGMMVAIGLQLVLQQIPVFTGAETAAAGELFSPACLSVAAGAMLILLLWQQPLIRRTRILSLIPGSLAAVLWGSLMMIAGDLFYPHLSDTVERIRLPELDSTTELAAQFVHPDLLQGWNNPAVYTIALTLALVASLETLLSQQALQKIRPQYPQPSPDAELRAQGLGNTLSGLLGGLPITAVIVRSSVNVSAGATSRLSVIWHGILLLLCGVFFETLLNTIPLATLAAVLIFTGGKLASPAQWLVQWRKGWSQFIPFATTVCVIISAGMLSGLAAGLVVQLLLSSWASHQSAIQLTRYHDYFVVRFNQNLTFLHNPRLQKLLQTIPDNSVVIAEYENAEYIDADIRTTLADFQTTAGQRGIRIDSWPR